MTTAVTPLPISLPRLVNRIVGLSGLGIIALCVALSDVLARAPAGAIRLAAPLQPPTHGFVFGTDALGRDVFSETIHALAVAAPQAVFAAAVAIVLGAVAGFAAVRLPARTGIALRGIVRIFGAVPVLMLAILFAALLGQHLVPFAVGLAAAPPSFLRSFDRAAAFADLRHAEFARATGIPATTLLRRDLVYEIRGHMIGVAARALATVTASLATVSFLGFSSAAPRRDLGAMIADAQADYLHAWWVAAFPALVLIAFILCARLAAALDEGEAP